MRSELWELAVYLEAFVLGQLEISLRERRRVRPVPIDVLVAFSSSRPFRGAAVDRANCAASCVHRRARPHRRYARSRELAWVPCRGQERFDCSRERLGASSARRHPHLGTQGGTAPAGLHEVPLSGLHHRGGPAVPVEEHCQSKQAKQATDAAESHGRRSWRAGHGGMVARRLHSHTRGMLLMLIPSSVAMMGCSSTVDVAKVTNVLL
jgi:hypothetical protein